MTNIVHSWLKLYDRPTDALNDLNEHLGTNYDTGHLTRWREEQAGLHATAINFMLKHLVDKRTYQMLRVPVRNIEGSKAKILFKKVKGG